MVLSLCCWRPLSIAAVLTAVLIGLPIGFMWDKLLGGDDRTERKHFRLAPKTREVLCRAESHEEPDSSPSKKHDDWAQEEFGAAKLADERLNRRLLTLARDFYERPQANLPQ